MARLPRNLRLELEKAGIRIPTLDDVDTIERHYEQNHWPSLGLALELLRLRWRAGERDEETTIRLLFLLWYALTEPDWLTGLHVDKLGEFEKIFEEAGGEHQSSPLVLLTVGRMTELFPWAVGDESKWEALSVQLIEKATLLSPEIASSSPTLSGAAGRYFRHQEWIM